MTVCILGKRLRISLWCMLSSGLERSWICSFPSLSKLHTARPQRASEQTVVPFPDGRQSCLYSPAQVRDRPLQDVKCGRLTESAAELWNWGLPSCSLHSSILAWRILWTEEPGGLPSMGSHRVRHDWSDLAATAAAASRSLSCRVLRSYILSTTHHTGSVISLRSSTLMDKDP